MAQLGYATLDQLKADLAIANSADDAVLQAALDEALGFIEGPGGAGRVFQATTDSTRLFDGVTDIADGSLLLWLDEDLCQITSVVNGDGVTIAPSLYVTNPRNRTPWYCLQLKWSTSAAWTFGASPENAISITGRWAYSVQAPADIHRAHKRLASWFYRSKSSQSDVDRPLLTPGGVTVMPSKVPGDVMSILLPYRRTTPV